ncbi:MAG: helix-turn-helix domain-containing protein [Actinomycetota bacterium]
MRCASEQGPVLAGVDRVDPKQDSNGPQAVERFDRRHHHVVWSPSAALQLRTPRQSFLASDPIGLWIPAGHPYDVEAGSTWWTARFDATSCPTSWNRLAQVSFDDVVGPMLIHLHRFPQRSRSVSLVSAVVDHLQQAFTANPVPIRFPTDPRARQIADELAADPSCSMELVDWAPLVGASERTLRRVFTEQTGVPFRRWRLRLRAQTATRLLRDHVPVAEVAARCGYRSPDSLSRAFRSEFGLSPTELAGLGTDSSRAEGTWPLVQEPCPPRLDDEGDDLLASLTHLVGGDAMNRLGRHTLLLGAALLVFAACGSDDDGGDAVAASASEPSEASESAADDASESTVAGDTGGTRPFVDDLGREVEIPAEPERVIFAGTEHASHVTTLGHVPLAVASSYTGDATAELEAIGGVPVDLGSMVDVGDGEPNFEAVAAAQPDLIVWWTRDAETVDILAEIAPTIAIDPRANGSDFRQDNDGARWSKQRTLAELFGLEDALDAQIAEYESLVADIRERHADLIGTLEWTLFDTFDDGDAWLYNTPTYAYNAALPDIGLLPAASHEEATEQGIGVEERRSGYAVISTELVPDYSADLVFVGRSTDEPYEPSLATVLDATPAGAAEQVFPVDAARWTFHLLQAEINVLREVDAILSAGSIEDLGDFG